MFVYVCLPLVIRVHARVNAHATV